MRMQTKLSFSKCKTAHSVGKVISQETLHGQDIFCNGQLMNKKETIEKEVTRHH